MSSATLAAATSLSVTGSGFLPMLTEVAIVVTVFSSFVGLVGARAQRPGRPAQSFGADERPPMYEPMLPIPVDHRRARVTQRPAPVN